MKEFYINCDSEEIKNCQNWQKSIPNSTRITWMAWITRCLRSRVYHQWSKNLTFKGFNYWIQKITVVNVLIASNFRNAANFISQIRQLLPLAWHFVPKATETEACDRGDLLRLIASNSVINGPEYRRRIEQIVFSSVYISHWKFTWYATVYKASYANYVNCCVGQGCE